MLLFVSVLLCSGQPSLSVAPGGSAGAPVLTAAQQQKVASGRLLRHIEQKYSQAQTLNKSASQSSITVAVYAAEQPSAQFVAELQQRGVHVFAESWIPPSQQHPLGFFLASMSPARVADVLSLDNVKKMDTAESETMPLNNTAAKLIGADQAWAAGWTGNGVKVGVLDSGLDLSYAGTDLPAQITAKDYSNYPTLDDNVANQVTGHGTHVTGSVLGRGVLSAANTANGGGPYKGLAPDASLVFLKIGNDLNAGASDAAEIAAIHAAVDEYHVNLINISYGGWDTFHDGTNPVSQAIDYAYSKGVGCIVAAGNAGEWARHASGFAPPNGMSDFIPVTVTNPGPFTQLTFNLVWFDGAERKFLTVLYYDANQQPLSEVTHWGTFESSRGTESQYSKYDLYVPNQSGTYYLRVFNPTSTTQQFHLYEDFNNGCVRFTYPDPNYTIAYPADADHAFAVGAYTSRWSWTATSGGVYYDSTQNKKFLSWSSRGPRVDGLLKPNITAPGSRIISLRDRNIYTSLVTPYVIDNDGIPGGDADYYVMEGTSMAAPICTGAAAILMQHSPTATPQQIYDAITQNGLQDDYTGHIPNPTWGFFKLDVNSAVNNIPLPVELTSFTSSVRSGVVTLSWKTATEVSNYGFELEKKETASSSSATWTKIGFVAGNGTSNIAHEYSFVDKLSHSGTFSYRLKQIDRDGKFTYSAFIEAAAVVAAPVRFALDQNYPNPFNPSTTMPFAIAAAGRVRLVVYDLLGREVAVLADRTMEPGQYSVQWNASAVPSGVYFYRLEAGNFSAVKKLLLQK
jgi:subtilisin family serine protease